MYLNIYTFFLLGIIDDINASAQSTCEYDYDSVITNSSIFLNEIAECVRRNTSLKGSNSQFHFTLRSCRDGVVDTYERVYTL